jgi:2-iminobutanoate/2-iminopropanoate deaminase
VQNDNLKIKIINSKKAPAAIGPYSQALVVGEFVFCSGQIGIDPKTSNLVQGIENQTKQILENLKNILEEAGSSLDKVIKTTIFLTNINDFQKVNEIYGQYFSFHKPARSTVCVASLPKGALIEIEAIALREKF